MKTYIFYSRRDKTKEAIGTIKALDRLDAIEKFSEIKKTRYWRIYKNV